MQDMEYIDNRSFPKDFPILVKTLTVVYDRSGI